MKKLLLLAFIGLLFYRAQSQSWPAPGATWNYRLKTNIITSYDLTDVVTYVGTVTINNQVCSQLNKVRTGWWNYGAGQTVWQPQTFQEYMYEQNGVLYRYDGIQFDTIVNFNAVPGQWWYASAMYDTANCQSYSISPHKVTVVDTGHIVLNALSLRSLTVTSGPASTVTKYVERIGAIDGDMNPYYCCHVDCGYAMMFSCYWDNNFAPVSMNGFTDCSFFVSIKEERMSAAPEIYPNPSSGIFNIKMTNSGKVEIYALTGEILLAEEREQGEQQIDLSNFAEGMYLLRIDGGLAQKLYKTEKQK